jgi:hypothetical protein
VRNFAKNRSFQLRRRLSRLSVLQRVFWQMQFGLNAFEVFRDRLPEPWERGPSLREKQMA